MKLLHVMAGAPTGGAENIFLESVLALADDGFQQAVVIRDNNAFRAERFRAAGIDTIFSSFNRLLRWETNKAIEQAISRFKPDLIQYWMGRAGTFAKRGRVPQLGWYGGYYKLKRFANCDLHIALTEDIQRHIIAQGAAPEHTAIIRTFAEFADVAPADRAAFDTPAKAPLLLALARLHWKKGLDVLLKALVEIPEAYLWIAGDGPLKAELEALTASLGLTPRVRFLGWRDDRAALLAAADICVFPSRYEPFGTVTVDAWAAKAPLIAAAAQGPRAYVTDGEDGLLVEIDDVGGLAHAIRRVIEEPGLKSRLVAGGTRSFEARFTKAVFLRESRALYERVLASGHQQARDGR